MLKRIHVNQHIIRANKRTGEAKPPLTVKTYRTNTRADQVEILGSSKVVYAPDDPRSCGPRVLIETEAPVVSRTGGANQTIA